MDQPRSAFFDESEIENHVQRAAIRGAYFAQLHDPGTVVASCFAFPIGQL